jgi:hypothetical protein
MTRSGGDERGLASGLDHVRVLSHRGASSKVLPEQLKWYKSLAWQNSEKISEPPSVRPAQQGAVIVS